MTIIQFGQEVEPVMPVMLLLYWLWFRDRSGYFGFDYRKPWIRETPLRLIMPTMFAALMLFIAYCTYLNNWT